MPNHVKIIRDGLIYRLFVNGVDTGISADGWRGLKWLANIWYPRGITQSDLDFNEKTFAETKEN